MGGFLILALLGLIAMYWALIWLAIRSGNFLRFVQVSKRARQRDQRGR